MPVGQAKSLFKEWVLPLSLSAALVGCDTLILNPTPSDPTIGRVLAKAEVAEELPEEFPEELPPFPRDLPEIAPEPIFDDAHKPAAVKAEPVFDDEPIDYQKTESFERIARRAESGVISDRFAHFLAERLRISLANGKPESKFSSILDNLPDIKETESGKKIEELLADKVIKPGQDDYFRDQCLMFIVLGMENSIPSETSDWEFLEQLTQGSKPLAKIEFRDFPSMSLATKIGLINEVAGYLEAKLTKPEEVERLRIVNRFYTNPELHYLGSNTEFAYGILGLANTVIELHKSGKISDETLLGFFELKVLAQLNLGLSQRVPLGATLREKSYQLFTDLVRVTMEKNVLSDKDWQEFFAQANLSKLLTQLNNGKGISSLDMISRLIPLNEFTQKLVNNAEKNGSISLEEAKDLKVTLASGNPQKIHWALVWLIDKIDKPTEAERIVPPIFELPIIP